MSENISSEQSCVIIGASHAGVNAAFALRKEGWQGAIQLYDADPLLPYHRPPLSKAYLSGEGELDKHLLKSAHAYEKEQIDLHLGSQVSAIHPKEKKITLANGRSQGYDKLVLATGAHAFIPPIPGIEEATHLFTMRTAEDSIQIREALEQSDQQRVLIIGGGYIGLETAASLRKLGAEVTVLEREERLLARVTAPALSQFFQSLHQSYGVQILTGKNVVAIKAAGGVNEVTCADGSSYTADMIVVGVGIRVNSALAEAAGLTIENGIRVDASTQTSAADIYAIGDCTSHYNPHYKRFIRLECVQNAVDQAKVAAAAICGGEPIYDTIPWFWSDQYDVKLQITGLSTDYQEALVRREEGEATRFSIWYFREDELLAVDAINHARAYMLGMKFLKTGQKVDKTKLLDPNVELKPANLVQE